MLVVVVIALLVSPNSTKARERRLRQRVQPVRTSLMLDGELQVIGCTFRQVHARQTNATTSAMRASGTIDAGVTLAVTRLGIAIGADGDTGVAVSGEGSGDSFGRGTFASFGGGGHGRGGGGVG